MNTSKQEFDPVSVGKNADKLFVEVQGLLEEKLAEFRREDALTRGALSVAGGGFEEV